MANGRESFFEEGFLHLRSFIGQKDCQCLILRMGELGERLCPKSGTSVMALSRVGHALHELCPLYHHFSAQEKFYQRLEKTQIPLPARAGDAIVLHGFCHT